MSLENVTPQNKKLSSKSLIIITGIIISSVISTPFMINTFNQNNPDPSNWLFISDVSNPSYSFNADGQGYILIDISGIDYTEFSLNDEVFAVSYGVNLIRYYFDGDLNPYIINIDEHDIQYFDTLSVEPIVLYDDKLTCNLEQKTTIQFSASGPISILTKPEFLYNWLYVELDGNIIKDTQDPSIYPKINPAVYAALVQQGSYVRYDISLTPGMHLLDLKGNGTTEIKIVTNMDFDKDKFSDSDEFMYSYYGLNPFIKDNWGYFEKSDPAGNILDDTNWFQLGQGVFNFYIPESCVNCHQSNDNYFFIDVYNGNFTNFIIDGDSALQTIDSQNKAELIKKFDSAVSDYQYKDASDFGMQIVTMTESKANIKTQEFETLLSQKRTYNADYDYYQTKSMNEFVSLIGRFYAEGIRAKVPFNTPLPPFFDNLFGYEPSNGILLIPNSWWNIKQEELADAILYINKVNTLPIKSNIQIDTQNLDIELYKDELTPVSIPLHIDGSDNPIVSIILEVPAGFHTISNQIIQYLKDPINFQMKKIDSTILADIYNIELTILYDSTLIFKDLVPFKVVAVSNLQIQLYPHPDNLNPIIPGDSFTAFSINNLGTIPEFIKIELDGSAKNFFDKTINPDDFEGDNQIFMIEPGISREGVRFSIPRSYSIDPGIYTYNAEILDYIVGTEFLTISKTFNVGEFYDILFANTSNLDLRASDSNTILYTFNVQNLGNVEQTFSFEYEGLSIATETFNKNSISLAPGEMTTMQLSLNPVTWGTEPFTIQVESQYNSTDLHGILSIYDDDTHAPVLSNLQIIDTPSEVRISFNILNENEGDDCGVSQIKIHIDNQLVLLNHPSSTQTAFNFIVSNGYMMEYATHNV